MNDKIFEVTISQFESEFEDGDTPDLEEYFKRLPPDSLQLCHELLHTDLELRIRNGHHVRVEHYLDSFPAILEDEDFFDDLIFTELKVRRQYEPGLMMEEYSSRFPNRFRRVMKQFSVSQTGADTNGLGDIQHEARPSYSDSERRFRKSKLHRQGGLGNVWLAIDRELGRQVAIKEIRPKFSESKTHRSRFAREALITSQLVHPGIVSIFGRGKRADGSLYFAMQFIRGRTLRSAISEFHQNRLSSKELNTNSLEFRRLIQHFLDVCNTMQYAHSQKVVHRDLKPENIMIGEFGETFVVDWGLAKADFGLHVEDQFDDSDLLQEVIVEAEENCSVDGVRIGSPGFMSPEQDAGDRAMIGPASDIFGLGATLYSIIGNLSMPVPSQLDNHSAQESSHESVSADFRQLKSICMMAMATVPDERYTSAAALAEDVENYLLERPVVAHRKVSASRSSDCSIQ